MKFTNLHDLEKYISSNPLPQVILLQSKDSFELKENLKYLLERIKKNFPQGTFSLKKITQETKEGIRGELFASSLFGGSDEVMLIENIDRLKGILDDDIFQSSAKLVILTAAAAGAPFCKKIDSHGVILDIPEIKAWEKQGKVQDWVMAYCAKEKRAIQREAAFLLAKEFTDDRFSIENELQKLFIYTEGKREIQEPDVRALLEIHDKGNLWLLHEAILQKKAADAMGLLHGLEDPDLHPLQIVRSLRSQFHQSLKLQTLSSTGANIDEIAYAFPQLKGKFLEKKLSLARGYGTLQLKKALVACDQVEVELKNSPHSEGLVLEKFIISLSCM